MLKITRPACCHAHPSIVFGSVDTIITRARKHATMNTPNPLPLFRVGSKQTAFQAHYMRRENQKIMSVKKKVETPVLK